jgi:DNA-binding CsgD family transcriptional regulator
MQTVNWQRNYEILKIQAERLLPENVYNKMVPEEMQKKEIELLKKTLHYEKFFMVINNNRFVTEHVFGINRMLGYREEDFTLKRYYSIIHPSHLVSQATRDYVLLESCISGKWPTEFKSHRFINTIALRHANGEYLLFKRLIIPFQHDDQFRMLSYLNEFTLLKPFNDGASGARITDKTGNNMMVWNEELLKLTRSAFEKQTRFSRQELRVLGLYADNPSISTGEIAQMFKVKESTVVTYKRRILNKAENIFLQRFETAKQTAAYLKEHGLI